MVKIEKVYSPSENISMDYSELEKYYSEKKVNLINDPQFLSLQLLSINYNFELMNYLPPRIYDRINESTIFTNGIDDYLFIYLSELFNKYEFHLSLKRSSHFVKDGRIITGVLFEHLETGQYFNLNNFNSNLITKLYSENYDNLLWIIVDGFDLTFEEIHKGYDSYEDTVETQVIHCQFTIENEKLFISYLDHEFIFYTLEEFENRQSNPDLKGEAQTRIKTFKIDNAMIPITDDENILINILDIKFQNKVLLEKYFNLFK